jgi:murein L,D-transpeptidase YcbB/YkuD
MCRGALAAALLVGVPALTPTAATAATPAATPAASAAVTPGAPVAAPAAFTTPIYPRTGRYLLVDAASARLFMIEDGEVVDSMRVIVGKPDAQTPTLASMIYYATLNPYWNVPADLARKLIAPRVLKQGVKYLRDHNYEVLASFEPDAPVISPKDVDWKAVAEGRATVKVRQLPGPGNSMGQVKFGFPNNSGIFLHDTPQKELFAAEVRTLSNGCIRLEDAARVARWLLGRDPAEVVATSAPEQHVLLPRAVPIYITYLNEPPNAGPSLASVAR